MTIKQAKNKLKKAREVVNSLEFGTQAWDNAMEEVKNLTAFIDNSTNFGSYTSREGYVTYCKGC